MTTSQQDTADAKLRPLMSSWPSTTWASSQQQQFNQATTEFVATTTLKMKSLKGEINLDRTHLTGFIAGGRAAHGSLSPTRSPSLAAKYATNNTCHSSAGFASHFAANTTPEVISKSFANAQTDVIVSYQADDASYSNGL
jgi:hypothetical protein